MRTFLAFVIMSLVCLFLSCKSDISNNPENTTPSNTIRNTSNSDIENRSNVNSNLEQANSNNLFNTNSTNKATNLTEPKAEENKANSKPPNNTSKVNNNKNLPIQNVNSQMNNVTVEDPSAKKGKWCYWFKFSDNSSISYECDGSQQACLKYKDEWSYQATITPCRQITKDLLREAEIACQKNVDIHACKWRDQVKFELELIGGK